MGETRWVLCMTADNLWEALVRGWQARRGMIIDRSRLGTYRHAWLCAAPILQPPDFYESPEGEDEAGPL